MPKVTLSRVSSLINAPTSINGILTQIEQAFDNCLSRNGASPNQMISALDMNSYKIINVPAPTSNTDLVRKGDLATLYPTTTTVADVLSGLPTVTLNTVAELKALTPTSGRCVNLLGYYEKNDGGAGVFYAVTGGSAGTYVDDGGVTILPTGGNGSVAWKRVVVNGTLSPKFFGAYGDGTTNDTTAVSKAFAACPAYGTIDLGGYSYNVRSPIGRSAAGVTVCNGKMVIDASVTSNLFYIFTANDYNTFNAVHFIGNGSTGTLSPLQACSQGGIFSGNTGYPSPMNTAPANNVTVTDCYFNYLTVGVFVGGASSDAVPLRWNVSGNIFYNIVGASGVSEGYGVLFSPANYGTISNNIFHTVKRHCVYIGSEASGNVVDANVIYGCDNIAIQSNTYITQNYADRNVISNNNISGLTKNYAYGYESCVGIGIYGKASNFVICGNLIQSPQDSGIVIVGEVGGSVYAEMFAVTENEIILDPLSTGAGIRINGVVSGNISNNTIRLKNAGYGINITSAVSTASRLINVSNNYIDTTNSSAIAVRISLSADRVVYVFNNKLNGFASTYINQLYDTSTAGTVRTDMNQNLGTVSTNDANFTHYAFGTAENTDCPHILYSGTLSADRGATLAKSPAILPGAKVTITRTGGNTGGPWNFNVYNGGGSSLLKALAQNSWATFCWNGSNWAEIAYGSSL